MLQHAVYGFAQKIATKEIALSSELMKRLIKEVTEILEDDKFLIDFRSTKTRDHQLVVFAALTTNSSSLMFASHMVANQTNKELYKTDLIDVL